MQVTEIRLEEEEWRRHLLENMYESSSVICQLTTRDIFMSMSVEIDPADNTMILRPKGA